MSTLNPIVPMNHPEPKKALDQAGRALAAIRKMQREAKARTDLYWERYLEDCKAHNQEPIKEDL